LQRVTAPASYPPMTQPLALVFYERLLPGTQLVNRLQDLQYRVRTIETAEALPDTAREAQPMVVLVDLDAARSNPVAAIQLLQAVDDTRHLPIIAFSSDDKLSSQTVVRQAGATIVTQDQALLSHLPQLLEQALQVE